MNVAQAKQNMWQLQIMLEQQKALLLEKDAAELEIAHSHANCMHMSTELAEARAAIATAEEERSNATAEVSALQAQLELLLQTLEDGRNEADAATSAYADCQKQLALAEEERSALEEESIAMGAKLTELQRVETEWLQLQDQLQTQLRAATILQDQLRAVQEDKQTIDRLKGMLRDCQQEVAALQTQLEDERGKAADASRLLNSRLAGSLQQLMDAHSEIEVTRIPAPQ